MNESNNTLQTVTRASFMKCLDLGKIFSASFCLNHNEERLSLYYKIHFSSQSTTRPKNGSVWLRRRSDKEISYLSIYWFSFMSCGIYCFIFFDIPIACKWLKAVFCLSWSSFVISRLVLRRSSTVTVFNWLPTWTDYCQQCFWSSKLKLPLPNQLIIYW